MSSLATSSPTAPPAPQIDARAYNRAHNGKLMIIHRDGAKPCDAADFFQFESAGTHPVGLFVTGVFEGSGRKHMLASAVRDATAAEIAWRRSLTDMNPAGSVRPPPTPGR